MKKLLFLPIIYLLMLSQVMEVDMREESGFVGESITLTLGYKNSSDISTVEWSIFTNQTFIATLRNGKVRVDRIPQFQGRLKLNELNGDLEIRDLKEADSRLYTADIKSGNGSEKIEIHLIVKHRLEKPTIEDLFNTVKDGFCVMALRCSSTLQGTNISWEWETLQASQASHQQPFGNAVELFVYFNHSASSYVNLTCIAAKDGSEEFSFVQRRCHEDQPIPPIPCNTCISGFAIFVIFVFGVIVGLLAYKCKEKLRIFVRYLQRKVRNEELDAVVETEIRLK